MYLELLVAEVVGKDGLQSRLGQEPPQFRSWPKARARHGAQPEGAGELHQAVLDTGPPGTALTNVLSINYIMLVKVSK